MQRAGSGPPLLLVHGYLVSHHYFRAVRGELERRFEVIAVDLPGHGESDRPPPSRFAYDLPSLAGAVADVMAALDLPRAAVWGHSMGGGVALTLAARHPERVERLVLEDAHVFPVEMPLAGRLALLPTVGEILFTRLYGKRDLARHLRDVHRDPAVFTDEDLDFFWERFNRPGGRAAAYAGLRALGALADENPDPARVRAPTLVVWGEEDRLIPLDRGRRLAREIPGARLEVIPACGHSPHEERPDELLRVVLPFLDSRRDASPSGRKEGSLDSRRDASPSGRKEGSLGSRRDTSSSGREEGSLAASPSQRREGSLGSREAGATKKPARALAVDAGKAGSG